MDGIAKRAGVAKGTVYLYYASKDEILQQILEEDLALLHEDTVPQVSEAGALDARLTRFLAAALTFFDRKRDFFEQAHFEMSPDVRRKALQKLETVYKAQLDAWSDAIIAAQGEGLVANTIDARACASTIVALAGGLGRQRLRGWIAGPVETVAGQASAALWHGMVAR